MKLVIDEQQYIGCSARRNFSNLIRNAPRRKEAKARGGGKIICIVLF